MPFPFRPILEGDKLIVQLFAVGNLKDVQDKAIDIAKRIPLPTGNCDRKGLNVVVDSIDNAKITPDGKSAAIELGGHVTVWVCVYLIGNDVKTKVASDSVQLSFAVELAVINGREIRFNLSRPAGLKTGNALSTEAALIFVGDLNTKLSAALKDMLDSHEAKAALPSLPGADRSIESAEFGSDGGTLIVRARGGGKLTSDAFNRALEFFTR